MNCVIIVKQVKMPSYVLTEKRVSTRKFVRTAEIDSNGGIHDVFTWNASTDTFNSDLDESYLLAKIAKNLDVPPSVVKQEFERRKQILLQMVEKNLRDFRSVHKALSSSLNVVDLEKTPEEEP